MDGLLTRLMNAIAAKTEAPRGMDAQVFEPACLPTWQSQVDAVDSILDDLEAA